MIPAALFVIVIPLVGAALAYALRRRNGIEVLTALGTCAAVIFLLARPAASVITLPGLVIDVDAPLDLIGRTLRVRAADRLLIVLLFASAAVIFALSWRAPQGWPFIPIGLTVLAATSAGLMIRPFVYAALAFETAAALAAVMIQGERNGDGSTRGAIRYLATTTLALPMFLLAGWVIDRAGNVNLADVEAVTTAYEPAIVLCLAGFALLLGAVPLFTWAHPVAKQASPLTTAFIGGVTVSAVTFMLLAFWQEYAWLRTSTLALNALTAGGMAVLLFGGGLAWAQSSFSRVMACAILVDVGCALLVVSNGSQLAVQSLTFGAMARALSLGVFGLGMWRLRVETGGDDDFVRARGTRDLWTAMALGIGGLSLAGLPGTMGFVSRWAMARAYSPADAEGLVLLLAASASVGVGVLRGLVAVYSDPLPVEAVQPAIVGDQLALFSAESSAGVIAPEGLAGDERSVNGEASTNDSTPNDDDMPRAWLDSLGARVVVGAGVTAVLILGLWPGLVAPLAQAVAEQFSFYR